ncbi:MAG: LysR family transcriptional regulator [Propionibacteriaceae bacterium]|nr:LysR family transcriptional regulator [Propionibacteriaceae bacterium]
MTKAFDLAGFECFVAVAQHRHFGAAAKAQGISVSTVTKRLQKLETQLGVPLVLRDSTGFGGLTAAGQRFIEAAPELLRRIEAAADAARGEPASVLRIAVPAGVGVVAPLLPAALGTLELALRSQYPGISVEAVPTAFPRLTECLTSGEVDAVMTFGESPLPEVSSTRLSPLVRVGVVAAIHPLAKRSRMPAVEFAEQTMIYSPGLPDHYMHPFLLADVRPLAQARLVPVPATTTAHVMQRLLLGREVTVVPAALTANLPPEAHPIFLTGLPNCWYHVHRRAGDDRPELQTAVELMGVFTESISRAALP